ncbi:ATP-dependent DNA helicase RecG [Allofustis seminis]|uniref:ATP-dependent DNA helicase RecG n=1 Tax=Allofustis seminis TaxID=166939 RepID=UPI00037BF101|nr:ATP-dependent DNA helicase RecG [Allofustis seminis]
MQSVLTQSVGRLKGVGQKRKEALNHLGIYSILDLLLYFPFRYEDLSVKDLHEIQDRQKIVLEGLILNSPIVQYFGRNKSRLLTHITVEGIVIPIVFFNQPYLKDKLEKGNTLKVFGTWDSARAQLSGIKIIGSHSNEENFESIYPASKEIKSQTIAKLIKQAWDTYHFAIPVVWPEHLKVAYHLLSLKEIIVGMHFPNRDEEYEWARRSFAFLELFAYQLNILQLKMRQEQAGHAILYDNEALKHFFAQLPFELTGAQKRCVNEICADLRRPHQMYRLLQGDVGSGKTVVSAAAMFAAYTAGLQSALMVPTEILAQQHFETLKKMFASYPIRIALLTGNTPSKERKKYLEQLETGKIDIVVGTHALIQEDVHFYHLGFILIDEQHRFGVEQRRALRKKGDHPDILFMTATPIPRTLSITSFGEMDISSIDELPPQRKAVRTHWIKPRQLRSLMEWLNPQIEQGAQIYVISPLIEESEHLEAETLDSLFLEYRSHLKDTIRIECLHGQMSADDKQLIMERFKNHEIDVLISTTVIEVGVDVPNAIGMVIHNADRFGLSQLHQLRGRVGRGDKASFCILIAEPRTEEGRQRLEIMVATNDGFVLSQKDLQMRGPGDWFGKSQSGNIEFKVADLVKDAEIVEVTRLEAEKIYQQKNEQDYKKLEEFLQLINKQENNLDILD